MPVSTDPVHSDDCAMMQGLMHHNDRFHGQQHHNRALHTDGCDPGISCRCHYDEVPARTQAVHTLTKMAGGSAVIGVTTGENGPVPFVAAAHSIELDASGASPPLFLKHGSFLN